MFFDYIFVKNPVLRRVWRAGFQIEDRSGENGETAKNTSLPQICRHLGAGFRSDAEVPIGRVSLRTSGVLVSGVASLHRQEAERCMSDVADLANALVVRNRRSFEDDSSESESASTPEMIMQGVGVGDTSISPILMSSLRKKSLKRISTSSDDHTKSTKRPSTGHQVENSSSESSSDERVPERPDSPTFTDFFYYEDNLPRKEEPSPEKTHDERDDDSHRVSLVDTNEIYKMNSIVNSAAKYSEQIKNIASKIINIASIYFEGNRSTTSNIVFSAASYSNAIRNLTDKIVKTAATYSAENMNLITETAAPGYSEEIRNILNDIVTSATKYSEEEIENVTTNVFTVSGKHYEQILHSVTKTVTRTAKYAKESRNMATKIVTCIVNYSNKIRDVTNIDDNVNMGTRNTDTTPMTIQTQTIKRRCEEIAVDTEKVVVERHSLTETDICGDEEVDVSQKSTILATRASKTTRRCEDNTAHKATTFVDRHSLKECDLRGDDKDDDLEQKSQILGMSKTSVRSLKIMEKNIQETNITEKTTDAANEEGEIEFAEATNAVADRETMDGKDFSGRSQKGEDAGRKSSNGTERLRRMRRASKKKKSGQATQSVLVQRSTDERSSEHARIDETLPFGIIFIHNSVQSRFPFKIVFSSLRADINGRL